MTATEYARKVAARKILAGPSVRNSCQRHLDDLEASKTGRIPYWFDENQEQFAVDFFEQELRLLNDPHEGKPFKVLPCWRFILGCLWGWRKDVIPENPKEEPYSARRFREAYIETGKGTAKSLYGAGIGILMMLSDGDARGRGYVFARTASQASTAFEYFTGLINVSPLLQDLEAADSLLIRGGTDPKRIIFTDLDYRIERLADDSKGGSGAGASGKMVSFILSDEVHEQRASGLYRSLRAGFKNRIQPLALEITNSGAGFEENAAWNRHEYSKGVAAGKITDYTHFSYVCEMDETDNPWRSQKCWVKAMPTLPVIPDAQHVKEEVRKSRASPADRAWVDQVFFCRWVENSQPWIERRAYLPCEVEKLSPLEERKEWPCFLSYDLSTKNDLTATGRIWLTPDRTLEAEIFPWAPGAALNGLQKLWNNAPFPDWAEAGLLKVCEGTFIRYSQIAQWTKETIEEFNVVGMTYDKRFIPLLEAALAETDLKVQKCTNCIIEGIPHGTVPLLPHPQGTQAPAVSKQGENPIQICMHRSIEVSERLIRDQEIKILKNPILRWSVLGVQQTVDEAHNRRFLKKSSKSKIDAAITLVMGIGLAWAWPKEQEELVYFF